MNKQIVMKNAALKGAVLTRYEGRSFTKHLGEGISIRIETGDYCNGNACMTPEYLEANPDIWENR